MTNSSQAILLLEETRAILRSRKQFRRAKEVERTIAHCQQKQMAKQPANRRLKQI